jgi:hypothetical protein
MPKYLKIIFIVILIIICIFLVSGWYANRKIYNSVFRLTSEEVVNYTKNIPTQCKKISDCKLLPGDILIRRYITEKTKLFDELLHPYFTHAAVYLGNDELFEVFGDEENPQDEIQIIPFSKSQWLYDDVNNFVVIRPKNYSDNLNSVIKNLRDIADDPEYMFGLPKDGYKKTSCGDIIVRVLNNAGMVSNIDDEPEIITPDYLFLVIQRDRTNFEIIGYN